MSEFTDRIIQRAAAQPQTIVLPEGSDPRTLGAAVRARDLGVAKIIVLADAASVAAFEGDLTGITIVDPAHSPDNESFAQTLCELRREKNLQLADARQLVTDELYHGVMMVQTGRADGMVAGATHATRDVLRPCLQILKTAPGSSLVSAFFVIIVPDCEYGENGTFLFADSGLVQHPDSAELAQIALDSAQSFQNLVGAKPVVAFLSHSTSGSAKSPSVERVQDAVRRARELAPNLALDGEFQLDAAIVPSVAATKAPQSSVAGKANVLIFPDLDSGNIAYKLAQRLAKAEAYGPITQGLSRPVNDLSRGASAEDILGVIAITAVQAGARKAAQADR
ncbi:MAG: phosphate acetyltransferase [Coriobacteriales bacterium]|nr:phosphate acetyltransferase [Coriobacteriales bacterium]